LPDNFGTKNVPLAVKVSACVLQADDVSSLRQKANIPDARRSPKMTPKLTFGLWAPGYFEIGQANKKPRTMPGFRVKSKARGPEGSAGIIQAMISDCSQKNPTLISKP
jgi:hypothetical protein